MKKIVIFLSLIVSLFAIDLEKSCQLGNGVACYVLSINYFNSNIKKAFVYAKKACNLNNAKGCMVLATFYKFGLETKKNLSTFKKYAKKSCTLGFVNACKALQDTEKQEKFLSAIDDKINFCKLPKDELQQYISYFKENIKNDDFNWYKAMMHLEVDSLLQRYNRISYLISSKEGYITRITAAENEAENLIMQGYLPENFTINTSNLLTKKGKINATFNSKNIAVILMRYLFPSYNMKKTIYRNILMRAYLIAYLHYITFETACEEPFDNWKDIFQDAYIFVTYVSFKTKNKVSIKVLFLLLNNNFDELDKFLISDSNVRKLTDYGLKLFYEKLANAKQK